MNALDVILIGVIFFSGLSGKYEGVYIQINRLLSIILSLLIVKLLLSKLISIFYPLIGLSSYTKPTIYYISVIIFYIVIRFGLNMFLYRYEPSKTNKIIDTLGAFSLAIINSILILSLLLSIIFNTINIPGNTITRLNESKMFSYIYTIKITLIDYER